MYEHVIHPLIIEKRPGRKKDKIIITLHFTKERMTVLNTRIMPVIKYFRFSFPVCGSSSIPVFSKGELNMHRLEITTFLLSSRLQEISCCPLPAIVFLPCKDKLSFILNLFMFFHVP